MIFRMLIITKTWRGVIVLLLLLRLFNFTTVHADFRLQASLLQTPMCTTFRCHPSYNMLRAPRVRGVLGEGLIVKFQSHCPSICCLIP